MNADEPLLSDALAARDRLGEVQDQAERRREEFHQAVRRLHSAGPSMRDIAQELGLSHQRVHQIVNGGEEMAIPTRRGALLNRLVRRSRKGCEPGWASSRPGDLVLDRFYPDAREVMSVAQEEARSFNHNYLGTEHVLLGLMRAEHGLAARLLRAVGADLVPSRTAIRKMLGTGPPAPDAGLSPTGRLKKVLEMARQEARSLRSTHVRSEHLLLGLAREGGGLGARVLAELGVGYEQLRGRVSRAALACSFCGRSGLDVASLIAGPGVFICEHCVEAAGGLDDQDDARHPLLRVVPEDRPAAACGFCGKPRGDVRRLVEGRQVSICDDCLAICREIVEEERKAFVPGVG